MTYVKVTGYLEVDDSDVDLDDPLGPLVQSAYDRIFVSGGDAVPLYTLEDPEVTEDDR